MNSNFKKGNIINHAEHGICSIEKIEDEKYHILINFEWRYIEDDISKLIPIPFVEVFKSIGFRQSVLQGGYSESVDTTSFLLDYDGYINGILIKVSHYFIINETHVSIHIEDKEYGNCLWGLDGCYLHEIQNAFLEKTNKEFDFIGINSILKK